MLSIHRSVGCRVYVGFTVGFRAMGAGSRFKATECSVGRGQGQSLWVELV